MRQSGLEWALKPLTDVLLRRGENGEMHREKKATWRWRKRLESYRPKPRNADSHQKLGKARIGSILEPSDGAQPFWHLDCRHLASRIVREYISVVFQSLSLCLLSSSRKYYSHLIFPASPLPSPQTHRHLFTINSMLNLFMSIINF